MTIPNPQPRRENRAYSLVELLLTTTLLLLFAGVGVVSLGPMAKGSGLDEGTLRFETMLRFARAQAANSGKRVRVNFVQDAYQVAYTGQLSRVQMTWEPNPATEPEVFQELTATQWGVDQVNETVGVQAVRIVDAEEAPPAPEQDMAIERTVPADAGPEEPVAPPSITFNPNGSSDSAEITLADRTTDDERRVVVRVEGFTGSITHAESDKDGETTSNLSEPDEPTGPP
jgi:Tfp pilus assembly protein FimT